MATIRAAKNPTGRIEGGDAIIAAAETVDTAPIKARFGRFAKVHANYAAAEKAVRAAYEKQRLAEEKVGASDARQEAAIDDLARALIGAGADKVNPFRAQGGEAPSRIKEQSPETRQETVKALIAKVEGSGAGKEVLAASAALGKAAVAVVAAQEAVAPLEEAHRKAKHRREALARPWEAELSKLKNAARTADDDHGTDLFATLFVATAPAGPSRAGRAERVARRKSVTQARQTQKEQVKAQRQAIAALAQQLAGAKVALAALMKKRP